MKVLRFGLPDATYDTLQREAERLGLPMATLAEFVVESFLDDCVPRAERLRETLTFDLEE